MELEARRIPLQREQLRAACVEEAGGGRRRQEEAGGGRRRQEEAGRGKKREEGGGGSIQSLASC